MSATGQGKDSQINITGSDVIGKGGTALYADGAINLQAAQNTHSEHSRSTSKGWNAGVSVNLNGGSPSFGFTAGGNKGKGYSDGEQTTYRHSHVGSAGSPTVIMSGGDTNIKGAQVTGKGITVRAANLNIESLQDTADYHSRQQNISAQVTVGYGASASGDYSKSKINAEHRSVSEQSGLFAGDDGFDVQVGGHTNLTGGLITSARSAEEQGKNRFQSGSISQTDLHNISQYDGSSIGFGTTVAVSGKSLGQEQQIGNVQLNDITRQNPSGFSSGYGRDSDRQESTTKSGIGTRNIILTDENGQLAKTGYGTDKAAQLAYSDIHTEDASQQSGSLKNRFDADKVQNELDLQRNVSQQFSQTVGTAQGMLNEKIDALKQQHQAGDITEADYAQKLKQLQYSQVFLNMVAAALSAPTDSAAGIAAATAAPAISYGIGQEFKNNKLKNEKDGGNRPTEGSATHIASHMALGAVVSALGGNDAVSGALAAGGAEALVPLFSKAIYDTKDPEKLTAEQKQNLSNMARLFGAAVGAANGYADVAQGSLNAGVAWENNGGVMDRPDGLTPDERALRERANRIYRDNVEAKNLYIQSYEEYQLKADYLATKEILVGTWDSIRHPIDTLTTIAEALSSPKQTVNNLIMTYQDWKTIRDSAYINDPKLAARMDAMFNARIGSNVTFIIVSGGTASAITKSSAALKAANTIKSAANSKVWQPVNQALQKVRLARELSKAADNLPPVPLKPVPAIVRNKGTGTVFDFIKPTQPNYPGSVIPKSFEMSLPNGKKIWVHGNASEHLAEFAQYKAKNYIPETVRLTSQQQLRSLRASIYTATKNGIVYDKMIEVDGWQLKFQPPRQKGQHPALIHALPIQ